MNIGHLNLLTFNPPFLSKPGLMALLLQVNSERIVSLTEATGMQQDVELDFNYD